MVAALSIFSMYLTIKSTFKHLDMITYAWQIIELQITLLISNMTKMN